MTSGNITEHRIFLRKVSRSSHLLFYCLHILHVIHVKLLTLSSLTSSYYRQCTMLGSQQHSMSLGDALILEDFSSFGLIQIQYVNNQHYVVHFVLFLLNFLDKNQYISLLIYAHSTTMTVVKHTFQILWVFTETQVDLF